MPGVVAQFGAITTPLAAVVTSILLGFMAKGKFRTLFIASLWMIPLWCAVLVTASAPREIEFEFGDWWVLLACSPIFLAPWATLTIFPFMLTVRLRKIHWGL